MGNNRSEMFGDRFFYIGDASICIQRRFVRGASTSDVLNVIQTASVATRKFSIVLTLLEFCYRGCLSFKGRFSHFINKDTVWGWEIAKLTCKLTF